MKNTFIVLGFIFLFINISYAYEKVYIPNSSRINRGFYNHYNVYNPYGPASRMYKRMYYNPYQYSRYNSNNSRRIKRLYNIMRLQRLRNNYLTWDGFQRFNPHSKGFLTGYSVPVNSDIYKQMGITPYNPKQNQNTKSSANSQELYSMPQGNESYHTNGTRLRDLGGVSGKTGVTVIYD